MPDYMYRGIPEPSIEINQYGPNRWQFAKLILWCVTAGTMLGMIAIGMSTQ